MDLSFLQKPSLQVAPKLLGWTLCRRLPEGVVKLKVVETESYHQDDPASHSFRGITKRTAPMFEAGGVVYVYFTYGMHYCINIVCGPAGRGEAVLIRAAEPVDGIEIMQNNRGGKAVRNLCNGPAKLVQALGITDAKLSGQRLGKGTLWLEPPDEPVKKSQIVIGPRIGISQAVEVQARFYIKNNIYVSKP